MIRLPKLKRHLIIEMKRDDYLLILKKKLGAFNIPFYPIQDLIKWMIDVTYNPHCHRGKTVVVWIWIGI